jgi:hypothetical protein
MNASVLYKRITYQINSLYYCLIENNFMIFTYDIKLSEFFKHCFTKYSITVSSIKAEMKTFFVVFFSTHFIAICEK